MIRVTCPHCGSKLNAKDELAGQTRKCPKCAQPFLIVADPRPRQPAIASRPPADAAPGTQPRSPEEALPSLDLPEHLNRESHYLICDRTHLVAIWQNNGHGWMLKTTGGLHSRQTKPRQDPQPGRFQTGRVETEPDARRQTPEGPDGVSARPPLGLDRAGPRRRADHWQDHRSRLVEPGPEERRPPGAGRPVHAEVWQDAADVLAYLAQHRLSLVRRRIVCLSGSFCHCPERPSIVMEGVFSPLSFFWKPHWSTVLRACF